MSAIKKERVPVDPATFFASNSFCSIALNMIQRDLRIVSLVVFCVVAIGVYYFSFCNETYSFEMGQLIKNQTMRLQSMDNQSNIFIIHTVLFKLEDSEPSDISLIAMLALKSAKLIGNSDKVKLYHNNKPPQGPNFDEARQFIDEVEQVQVPTEIFGKAIKDLTHAKDVFEIETLRKNGGAFIDLDIFVLSDLRPLFENYQFVMGKESQTNLLAAMVIAQKDSFFLNAWHQAYENFDDHKWSIHSGIIPKKLSEIYPEEIKILDFNELAKPCYDHFGLQMAFLDRTYDYEKNIATHLWSHMPASRLLQSHITKDKILTIDTSLFCLLRHFVTENSGIFQTF